MFIKNNRRFNLNAYLDSIYIDENGTQHPGQLLRDTSFRESQGITEIEDPERGDDETQYTQEIDVDPWVIITNKSPEQIKEITISKLTNAVQSKLDIDAQEKGYDSILSACSYAGFTNLFQAEGISFLEWRSACWSKCYQVLAEVEANTRTTPTVEELLAELPARVVT
jgi:hypothetical protein